MDQTGRLQEALGQSEEFLEFQERLSRVAPIERPVLLLGERGTGKELAAKRLHFLSRRWEGPMVTLNCATLSPTLIEAELFGHEKGAFTGAEMRKTGRFETADGGTLFLDEIGSIPMQAQEKILRVVEYGSFERVGSGESIEVDVRIIGATNADLSSLAQHRDFKPDLLDRLSFEVLFLPPLRFRRGDIELLANHFATKMAFELGRGEVPNFSTDALEALERYSWPGNVRELKNVVERAVYRAADASIDDITFNPFLSPFRSDDGDEKQRLQPPGPPGEVKKDSGVQQGPGSLKKRLADMEVRLIREALNACKHNQRQTAAYLHLSYDQLRGKMKKYAKSME